MDFSEGALAARRREAAGGPSASPSPMDSETLLTSLAHHNATGNVVTNISRMRLNFDAFCDAKTTRWDDKTKKCVAHTNSSGSNAGGDNSGGSSLCAPGSEAVATMCRKRGHT